MNGLTQSSKDSKQKPRGRARWNRLSPGEQNRLRYKRARWRASNSRPHRMTAKNIRELRKKLGYSQTTLAGILRVNVRTVKRWEGGQFIPTGRVTKWFAKHSVR